MVDYSQKIREDYRHKQKRKIMFFFFAGLISVLIIISIFVLRGDLFHIKNYDIQGNHSISTEEIIKKTKEFLSHSNWLYRTILPDENSIIFYIKKNDIKNKLMAQIPSIKDANFSVDIFPPKITINVSERNKFALWCIKKEVGECFWFDSEGIVFEKGPWSEGELIRKITDEENKDVFLGKNVIEQRYLKNIQAIFEFLEKSNISRRSLFIQNSNLAEIQTSNLEKPIIYFSLKEDPNFALSALEKIKDKLHNFEYIDFRVNNRVYYK